MGSIILSAFTILFGISAGATEIVAFHGLNQSIRSDAVYGPHDCTAGLVNFEDHRFIENTIPSIAAAFNIGATIGHINLRKTVDKKLAVFHDEDLSCRTDGKGNVSQSPMAYLKQLDVGYNYTPDGKTFPTRGLGKNSMPTFEEVLSAFPTSTIAINVKNEDEETAQLIEEVLVKFPKLNRKQIIYIGNAKAIIRKYVSGIQLVASKKEHLECLGAIETGKSVELFCKDLLLALPFQYAKDHISKLPGIVSVLHHHNSKIWIWDVNSPEDASLIKPLKLDAIGSYRVDKIVPALN